MVRPRGRGVKLADCEPKTPNDRIQQSWVVVGLGSNLGDRDAQLASARTFLQRSGFGWTLASSIVETDPVGLLDQPRFLNQVLAARRADVELSPEALLAVGQRIEREAGRVRTRRWGPRPIDIDLLLWGDLVVDQPELTIPHPRLHERQFVLQPLAEILPHVIHPSLDESIETLARRFVA